MNIDTATHICNAMDPNNSVWNIMEGVRLLRMETGWTIPECRWFLDKYTTSNDALFKALCQNFVGDKEKALTSAQTEFQMLHKHIVRLETEIREELRKQDDAPAHGIPRVINEISEWISYGPVMKPLNEACKIISVVPVASNVYYETPNAAVTWALLNKKNVVGRDVLYDTIRYWDDYHKSLVILVTDGPDKWWWCITSLWEPAE